MDRAGIIDALRACLERRGSSVVCAYLYGSVARDEARPTSDVDVAALFRETPPSTLDGMAFDLAGEIERVVGRPVDLVVLDRASPDLVHRVLRDGILVHESDRGARVRFETRKRAEYFDVLPYLREYRRSAAERVS
jgi:predicted nucleotidyltransferase